MKPRSFHKKNNKSHKKPSLYPSFVQSGKEWVRAILSALVIWIVIRFFVMGFVTIPNSSMEDNLLAGDWLIQTNYQYGARMPLRIMPSGLFNNLFWTDTLLAQQQLPYWRFPGNRKPKQNDLVVFNAPSQYQKAIDQRITLVKRLVGTPGDIVFIDEGQLMVNGVLWFEEGIKRSYILQLKRGASIDEDFLGKYHISEGGRKKGRYVFTLSDTQKAAVLADERIRDIKPYVSPVDKDIRVPFGEVATHWSLDSFGPLVVPQKNEVISLDANTIDYWKYLLVYHERIRLETRSDSVFINGKYQTEYSFKQNYYFVMGDNRHNSWDSRVWGLVPESHIKGRAGRVLMSLDTSAPWYRIIRWNRIFHKPQ